VATSLAGSGASSDGCRRAAEAGRRPIGVTMPLVKALLRRIVPFPARRAFWRVRRNVPRVAQPLSLVLARAEAPGEPVLVIGCPRAGTSALQELLVRSPELGSVHNEGHILWDAYQHPRDRGWDSDALGAADVSDRERAYIYLAIRMFARAPRFVDKTAESCLRIPYLLELFRNARFVFLHREAAGNVNSLIEGWGARPRFVKYRLPETLDGLGELSGNRWSFALIPGWRELRDVPLEEICARQYVACNQAALDGLAAVDPSRRFDLSYERMFSEPLASARELYAWLGLEFAPEIESYAAALHRTPSFTALTAPRPDKWREQNPEAIERILPLTAATERRLGYEPVSSSSAARKTSAQPLPAAPSHAKRHY
jgi:Sulfotransferase family